jgi:hypothetical protein
MTRTTGPGQSPTLLMQVATVLRDSGIDYATVGAIAASFHGVVRTSMDADAVLRMTVQELGALQKKFDALGLRTELRRGDYEDPIAGMLLTSDDFGNRVDLIAGLRGLDSAAYGRTIDVPFIGGTLRVIGREDFIAMKCFAGGPVDLMDARRAVAVNKETLDTKLLNRLLDLYGKAAVRNYEQLKSDSGV